MELDMGKWLLVTGFGQIITILVAVLLFSVLGAGQAQALEYYVSPAGLDTNPGTIGAPFKTLGKAKAAVRAVNGSMSADIIVYLRGGWHVLSSPLGFTSNDNGNNGFNVIYQAYPGERPVVSGGRQITGWTLHDAGKNIWKAAAPGLETRQLYVDCKRAVRAHKGAGISGGVKTATGYTTTEAAMQNWGNKSDIEFVYNGIDCATYQGDPPYRTYWKEHRLGVQSISGNAITMEPAAWTHSNEMLTTPSDIENAYELLDQEGEWYLNRATDVLYYKPLGGQKMAQVTVIAPVLEKLVTGTGTAASPVRNLQFKGITFAHATWLGPNGNGGFIEQQANKYHVPNVYFGHPGGNVVFKAARSIRFERCIFTHLGGEGLELSGGAQDCVVTGCVFTDISANCLRIGTTEDPTRTDTRLRDTGNQVTNCYIHDAPCEYHGGVGILAGYVSGLLVSRNEIASVPYSGISCGWGWGATSYMQNNQFTYNHIHRFCQRFGDGGGIYTLSSQPNSKWNNNWFDNMPSRTAGGAIYPDEASAGVEIDHNVCSNIGRYWLYIWTSTINNINVHDTWTTTSTLRNNGTSCPVTNTVLISGALSTWPAGARSVANNAGIQAAYREIKTISCACSINNNANMVNLPIITPGSGNFADSVEVSITCATAGAAIRYTIDGSDPASGSALYTGPVVLRTRGTVTVKARANKSGMDDSPLALAVFNITPASCRLSNTFWQNTSMAAQSDTFTVVFNAWVSVAPADGIISLSRYAAYDYSQAAVIIRFNTQGQIDARNGAAYTADAAITYTAGTEFRFRVAVDVPAHRYSVYVASGSGSEETLAQNYAFRAEQASVNELNMWNVFASTGEFTVCDFSINSAADIRDDLRPGVMMRNGQAPAGEKVFTITGQAVPVENREPGVYIIRTGTTITKKLIIH